MYQTLEIPYDEQVTLYKKLKKRELIKMLIECNRIISNLQPTFIYPTCPQFPQSPYPTYPPTPWITYCGDTSAGTIANINGVIEGNSNTAKE